MERMCVSTIFVILSNETNQNIVTRRMKLMQNSSLYGDSLRAEAVPKGRYGPIPGIKPGTTFKSRCSVLIIILKCEQLVISSTERSARRQAYMPLATQAYMDLNPVGHILFVYPEGMKTMKTKETFCASSCCISEHR